MSESELLRASLAGSKEAFGVVVQRYQVLVCAIAYSATGDIGRSEELAQEAFLRAWKNLRQLEDLGNFRAWLCTIARNLISRSMRQRPKDVIQAAHPLQQAEAVAAATPDPEQTAIDKELQDVVWAAVRCVPQKYRQPLVLFYREQQSVSQVAADLGLSEEMVRQRLHRGRQLLKAEIATLVGDTLARSGPGKAFAIAVVAALPALVTPTASAAVAGMVAKGTPAAKTLLAACSSGALLGPILGMLGGILGVWCGVRNGNSPCERRFAIRMTILTCLLGLVVLGIPLTLAFAGLVPQWAWWLSSGVFLVLLLPLLLWSHAHQPRIQIEGGTSRPREYQPRRLTRRAVYWNFAGSILGATLWLLVLTVLAGDGLSFGVIVGCDILVFLLAAGLCVRNSQRYWSVAFGMACALMAMTLAAVNLRWTAWMHAYRESAAYDPRNDVSLMTVNLIVLSVFVTLLAVFAMQYVQRRGARKRKTRNDDKQP